MKKITVFGLFLLVSPLVVSAAPRRQTVLQHDAAVKVALVKGGSEGRISEKERDHLMFTNFVGIVVNFVKLFMDPNNIPEAKQNAYNILNGINNLAHVITRSGLSQESQEELIEQIIKLCKNCEA